MDGETGAAVHPVVLPGLPVRSQIAFFPPSLPTTNTSAFVGVRATGVEPHAPFDRRFQEIERRAHALQRWLQGISAHFFHPLRALVYAMVETTVNAQAIRKWNCQQAPRTIVPTRAAVGRDADPGWTLPGGSRKSPTDANGPRDGVRGEA